MTDNSPDTNDGWLPLTCSFCQARFRIRTEYAHLRGRCPACGFRIAAPYPKPYEAPLTTSDSDEPLGLLPVDDEWPEPGRLEEREPGPVYALDAPPVIPAASEVSDEPDAGGDVYMLADDKPVAQAPAVPVEGPAVTPYKFADQIGETPPPPPPVELAPAPALPQSQGDQLPVVELAPAAKPVKSPAPPKPEPPAIPTQPPAPAPANIIDALFQEPPPAPAPVPTAPGIPVATYAASIPVADFASAEAGAPPPKAKPAPAREPVKEIKPEALTKRQKPDAERARPKAEPGEKKRAKDRPQPTDASPTEKESASSGGSPPSDASYTYQLNSAELAPVRAGVPKRPFVEGVFGFPWRPSSLGPLLWIAAGLMILAVQGRLIMLCLEAGLVGKLALAFVCLSMLWVVIWTCSYASVCLLAVVQDTANGGDEVGWPEGSWRDWFFPFLRVAWIGFFSGLVGGVLSLVAFCLPPTAVLLVVIPPMFLIMLLSSMAGDSWFTLVSGKVLDQLGRRLPETIGVAVGSIILFAITTGAAFATVGYAWFLAPVTGLVGSACWLLYGRLVGRLGWVITHTERKKRRRKKKKRKGEEAPDEAREADAVQTPEDADRVAESDWA